MKYLGVRAAALELGVHENTIRRWEERGIVTAIRLPGSNFRRFRPEDIEAVRQRMVETYQRSHSIQTVSDDTPVVSGSFDQSLWES